MDHLNLARRPFLNTRPVTRVALLLWALGALLLIGNVTLFWGYLSSSTDKREELAQLEQQVEKEREQVGRLEARIARLELGQQNEQVEYLNEKIAERTFSWSLLFDRLAETMPDDVRLIQLQPAPIGGDERPGARRTPAQRKAPLASDQVPLIIEGEAKSDEDLFRFVENLFAHTAFDNPDFLQDEQTDDNHLRFTMRVTYLPHNATPGVTIEEEPTPAPSPAPPPAAPPSVDDSETE